VRVVITGGGSGGHLFPGVAVAEELKRRDRKMEVIFIGTEKGIESRVIPKEGYPIKYIKARGVLGKSLIKKIAALWEMAIAVLRSRALLRALAPDLVIGTGGYVSVGPVAAARLLGIPTVIAEQNLVPGSANRLLARIADAIAVTYHESLSFFPREKTRITGNPVRAAILSGKREEAIDLFSLESERITVLIFGGSSGARKINEAVISALELMLELRDRIQFLHQTGQSDYERMRKMYRDMGYRAMVVPFIHQMAEAYAVADVVVARAGATTLAEITALGKPAVLVPYPHAAGHQEFNARKLLEIGGCRVVRDNELTGRVLAMNLRDLCTSEDLRSEMRRQSRALGRPDAAQRVTDLALSLVNTRSSHV
jgi:UDP-N-acetylglucosamine--N-acetylmuramyl-(pentapeptide) pyrophosphoryl-undecaprenol N-acetylglucosamine transferase